MRFCVIVLTVLAMACSDGPTTPQTPSSASPESPASAAAPPGSSTDASEDPADGASSGEGNVTIESPADGTTADSNPIEVSGTARTFENNVVLQVRDATGDQILETSTTARGDLGQFNPWTEELWLTEWPGERITIRALEHSAKDGSIRSLATVTLDSGLEKRDVTLWFANSEKSPNDCSRVFPVSRTLPNSIAMAELLTRALIAGPTPGQQEAGYSSGFPRGARLSSVALENGTLTLDFSPEMQNVGGSCRVQAMRASLEKTLGQLDNVDRVKITAGGSEELALQP